MKDILDVLTNNGYEAFIVGGYVRDLLLGIDSKDIDICTNAKIEDIIRVFNGKGIPNIKYYSYHIEHDNYNFDITSYRKELEYKKNKPTKIEYAYNVKEDLERRDFTINTMLISLYNNKLYDKLDAKKDIDNKIIKVVGNTYKKFNEDKTRILRAIRFSVTLNFKLDSKIQNFLKTRGYLLNEIPNEFKRKEIDKILDSENYYMFFDIVKKYNLEEYLGIHFNETKPSYNKYGIYAQMNVNNLPFTRKEKKMVHSIRLLIDKRNIDIDDINKYDDEILLNAATILKKTKLLKVLKEINKLHSNLDIDINMKTMLKYIDIKDVQRIYRLIESNIISEKLINREDKIIEFIKEQI